MGLRSEIRTALETQLATVAGLPSAGHWAHGNKRYEPNAGTPWLRLTHTWGDRRRLTLPKEGAWVEHNGLLLVDLMRPLAEGEEAADVLVDAICTAFPLGWDAPLSGGVRLEVNRAQGRQGRREDDWFLVPVELGWVVRKTQ